MDRRLELQKAIFSGVYNAITLCVNFFWIGSVASANNRQKSTISRKKSFFAMSSLQNSVIITLTPMFSYK